MPRINSNIRVTVPVGIEEVVFVCRRPDGQEISKFLNSRFETRRNKVQSKLYEARERFIDAIVVDVENVTFDDASGQNLPLNKATVLTDADKAHWAAILHIPVDQVTWKALIPLNWKSSAATFFEDPALGGDEQGD
jgi:hypothetical protein